jgi:hypothetical protein
MHGGKRPGAGRKAGSATKRTREIANAIADGLTPLEFLTNVYRDVGEDMSRRVDAAKAAAQYVHPKLAAIEHSADEETVKSLAGMGAFGWQAPQ